MNNYPVEAAEKAAVYNHHAKRAKLEEEAAAAEAPTLPAPSQDRIKPMSQISLFKHPSALSADSRMPMKTEDMMISLFATSLPSLGSVCFFKKSKHTQQNDSGHIQSWLRFTFLKEFPSKGLSEDPNKS